jgi:hypothetical protein
VSSAADIARGIDWPAQWTIRTLKDGLTERWSRDLDGLRRNASVEQQKYFEAREAGDTDVAAVIVGEAVDCVHGDQIASDIIARIASETEMLLRTTALLRLTLKCQSSLLALERAPFHNRSLCSRIPRTAAKRLSASSSLIPN